MPDGRPGPPHTSVAPSSIPLSGATRPLTADLSAPFGFYPSPPKLGILGLLRPQQSFNHCRTIPPVKNALIFRANPRIDRVVFVAAPYRGAPLAINRLAEFGASFIRLPRQVLSDIGTATLKAATSAAGIKGNFIPTSVTWEATRFAQVIKLRS